MHALHSLTHRAPPATRSRVRWQPYSSIPSSCSSSSSRSPASYLNTPAASVTPSPQITSFSNEPKHIPQSLASSTLIPKDIPTKDTPRNRYINSLVDQAVKSLSEIWRPQDIPSVFVSSAHSMAMASGAYEAPLVLDPKPIRKRHFQNIQLPSPVSPSPTSSPSLSVPSSPLASAALPTLDIAGTLGSRGNLVPIKSFVHEVLRRSRTSGCVLQTALCYLEAIRSKVPALVRAEKAGEGVQGEEDRSDWIVPATADELEREAQLTATFNTEAESPSVTDERSLVATVRVDDISSDSCFGQSSDTSEGLPAVTHQRLSPGPVLPSLPPLPSPLLCPRRAFLASLILASKFTQDKCYSNRAWAKLSGLPPREIGRCERALGEALDWRLWVGKQPYVAPASPTLPALAAVPRTLARSQSESCLLPATQGPFLVREQNINNMSSLDGITENRALRRHGTLPADAFTTIQAPLGQVPWRTATHVSSSQCPSGLRSGDDMNSPTPTEPLLDMGNDVGPLASAGRYYSDTISQSPSPPTPGLSYSPSGSSTESCSGDRTIQMFSFLDDPANACTSGHMSGSDSWPWLDSSDAAHMSQPPPSVWIHCKHNPRPIGSSDSVVPSGVDFKPPSPFKSDIGTSTYPLISVSESGAAVYPLHW